MAFTVDPFPAISRNEAKRLLRRFFGIDAVYWELPFGPVFIQVLTTDGTVRTRRFTWQQAKYLAACPLRKDDLVAGRYPLDWPE
jgi:hypothetical protein